MRTFDNWYIGLDDLSIFYDNDLSFNVLSSAISEEGKNLPPSIAQETDVLKDVRIVDWNGSTKKADITDYRISIACGVLSGFINFLYIGELSLEKANNWGKEAINEFVKTVAKKNGYEGDELRDAISYLEKNFGLASDKVTAEFGGGLQHHLRDFTHHFSLTGLIVSILTQFTQKVIGTDTEGNLICVDLQDDTYIGKNFKEKLSFGIIKWFFHLVSDMAGSRSYAGNGTGIPGPFLSLIKELSSLPLFRDKKIDEIEFYKWVSKLFNGTLYSERDSNGKIIKTVRFDLRTEIGLLHNSGSFSIPVIINECLVRVSYFIRRLYMAIKEKKIRSLTELNSIDVSDLLPFNNRVITRMITVSMGTFTCFNLADATVRTVIKNLDNPSRRIIDFATRINFVGIGRFVISFKDDVTITMEDTRNANKTKLRAVRKYEKYFSHLDCLSMNFDQRRVLYSLERLIILDDISITKDEKQKKWKSDWKHVWEEIILENLRITQESERDYFLDGDDVFKYMDDNYDNRKIYLIVMEAMLFKPYSQIYGNKEEGKRLKKLHFQSNYLTDVFTEGQRSVINKDIEELDAAFKKSYGTITKAKWKIGLGVTLTAIPIVYAGVKYGAKLQTRAPYSLPVNRSIPFASVHNELGFSTVIQGGMFICLIGGASLLNAGLLDHPNPDKYALYYCCILLTYSEVVLLGEYGDIEAVGVIQSAVKKRIKDLQEHKYDIIGGGDRSHKEKTKEKREILNAYNKTLKYLQQCDKALQKLLDKKGALPSHPQVSGDNALPDHSAKRWINNLTRR